LSCLEKNGVLQYITGLNEFAPEIKLIKDLTVTWEACSHLPLYQSHQADVKPWA
jgi:hypothetical protein